MLESLLTSVTGGIVATISTGGYIGVILLMAIESACIPLPSEIIMPFAGYLAPTGRFNLMLIATAGAVGCNLGSVVAYEIGRKGGRPLVERWGSWVLLGQRDLELADRFFFAREGDGVPCCRMRQHKRAAASRWSFPPVRARGRCGDRAAPTGSVRRNCTRACTRDGSGNRHLVVA